MAAAYLVKYSGPRGEACPDCVVPIQPHAGECIGELAARIKTAIVRARGGSWKGHDVTLRKVEYLGPWFEDLVTRTCPHVQAETVQTVAGERYTYLRAIDPNKDRCEVCRKLTAFDALLDACQSAEEWINEAGGPAALLDKLQAARKVAQG